MLLVFSISSILAYKYILDRADIDRKKGIPIEEVMSLIVKLPKYNTLVTIKDELKDIMPLSYFFRSCDQINEKLDLKYSKIIFVFDSDKNIDIEYCLNKFQSSTFMIGGLDEWMSKGLPTLNSENSKNFIGACSTNGIDDASEKTCL